MIRECIADYKRDEICKGTSARSKAHGIAALVNFEEPVITRINDIALDGMSFLHGEALQLPSDEIIMDILIFDVQTNIEYFFSHVKGKITSKVPFADSPCNRECSKFSVEFLELTSLHLNVLQEYMKRGSTHFHPE